MPSILGMREWLDELGHSVLVLPILVWANVDRAVDRRYKSTECYSCRWNERQRKHMCIHWYFPESPREKNRVSREGWPIHLTTSLVPRRENPDQFPTDFERALCKVLLRGGRYIVAAPPSGIWDQAPLSPIICAFIVPYLYQGRRRCRHIWDSPWGRIRLYKYCWETCRYNRHDTWNRSY